MDAPPSRNSTPSAPAGVPLVMIALMQLERLDEATDAGRAARTLLLPEGDQYRPLAALLGRTADAARILSDDDANLASTGR